MKHRIVVYISATVITICLVFAGIYGTLVYLQVQNNQNEHTENQTLMPTPTLNPTPLPTQKPAPGVTSIDFTRWHPSNGENIITIVYPTEKSTVETTNMTLKIQAASKNPNWAINSIYYTADWLGSNSNLCFSYANLFTDNIELKINFHDIPDGFHTFTAYLNVHDYSQANATVHFTIKSGG